MREIDMKAMNPKPIEAGEGFRVILMISIKFHNIFIYMNEFIHTHTHTPPYIHLPTDFLGRSYSFSAG